MTDLKTAEDWAGDTYTRAEDFIRAIQRNALEAAVALCHKSYDEGDAAIRIENLVEDLIMQGETPAPAGTKTKGGGNE